MLVPLSDLPVITYETFHAANGDSLSSISPGRCDCKDFCDFLPDEIGSLQRVQIDPGVLFILITAIVCFSTLTIIIDEQKKLIGTAKAFVFHKREVL